MTISIRPLGNSFAGEVSGIDITRPISREDVPAIEAGMDAWAVLVFRDQHLTDEQQITFTPNFGELENYKAPGNIRKRSSPAVSSLPGDPTPSSPTCARPTTRSTRAPRRRSRT